MSIRSKASNSGNPAAVAAYAKGDIENAIVAATPGGIEAQEARGQQTLTARFNQLPKEFYGGFPRETLERLGFKIGDDIDDLFVAVTAPAGWQLRPTSHSMHSEIVDDRGRVRGGVFYKAAFYDRRASFDLSPRYQIRDEYDDEESYEKGKCRKIVRDNADGAVFHAMEWRKRSDFKAADAEFEACREWLDANFPDRSVEAYW